MNNDFTIIGLTRRGIKPETVELFKLIFKQVTVDILNQLISKIQQEMDDIDESDDTAMIKTHFDNSVRHVKKRIDPAASEEADA